MPTSSRPEMAPILRREKPPSEREVDFCEAKRRKESAGLADGTRQIVAYKRQSLASSPSLASLDSPLPEGSFALPSVCANPAGDRSSPLRARIWSVGDDAHIDPSRDVTDLAAGEATLREGGVERAERTRRKESAGLADGTRQIVAYKRQSLASSPSLPFGQPAPSRRGPSHCHRFVRVPRQQTASPYDAATGLCGIGGRQVAAPTNTLCGKRKKAGRCPAFWELIKISRSRRCGRCGRSRR